MAAAEEERLAVTNLKGLGPWTGHLVRQFLDLQPDLDPSFGGIELGVVPPFGPLGGR
jgi:hypothetical protein